MACRRGDTFLVAIVRRLIRIGSLTPRMGEAIRLYVHGWAPDVAARHMGCALNTYRNHLAAALRRVGAEAPNELFRVLARDLDAHPIPREFDPSLGE
jgi:DNA-binding NarL/FixJ family response regulator